MTSPSPQPIKCNCCQEEFPEKDGYIDPDLKSVVCPDCKELLRWAQAYLKKAGIKDCIDK